MAKESATGPNGSSALGDERRDGNVPKEAKFPWRINDWADILPGKLFDVRSALEAHGAKFEAKDFAWYNPEGGVLIIGASKAQIDQIDAAMASSCGFNFNLLLDGEITVGRTPDAAVASTPWQVRGKSGQRLTSSVNGTGLSYRFELEPTIGPDGASIDCALSLEAKWEGKSYAVTTSQVIYRDKPQTTLLGTTVNGEKVELRLKLSYEPLFPDSKLGDVQWKAALLERVRKMTTK